MAYAIDSAFGPCPVLWANSAWQALIESDFESNFSKARSDTRSMTA